MRLYLLGGPVVGVVLRSSRVEFEEPTSGLTGVASYANLFSLTFLLRDLLEFLEESLARRLSRSESLLCLLFSESMD